MIIIIILNLDIVINYVLATLFFFKKLVIYVDVKSSNGQKFRLGNNKNVDNKFTYFDNIIYVNN